MSNLRTLPLAFLALLAACALFVASTTWAADNPHVLISTNKRNVMKARPSQNPGEVTLELRDSDAPLMEAAARGMGIAHGFSWVALRYFNVAGAGWPDLADTAVMNLVPIVFAALRDGKAPKVFGDDYATPDGSCVRDYVHVLDLAEAHLAALDYLERDDRPHTTFNVGTGTGSSVFEVIEQIRRTTGQHFEIDVAERRAGDPPYLCADVSRIRETLDWRAKNGLAEIIDSAWAALQA